MNFFKYTHFNPPESIFNCVVYFLSSYFIVQNFNNSSRIYSLICMNLMEDVLHILSLVILNGSFPPTTTDFPCITSSRKRIVHHSVREAVQTKIFLFLSVLTNYESHINLEQYRSQGPIYKYGGSGQKYFWRPPFPKPRAVVS